MTDAVWVAIISGVVTLGSILFGIWVNRSKEKNIDDIETRKEYNRALVAQVEKLNDTITKKDEIIEKQTGVIEKWTQDFYQLNTKFQILIKDKEINDAKLAEALKELEAFKNTMNTGISKIAEIAHKNDPIQSQSKPQ